jgi:hypothetical protein
MSGGADFVALAKGLSRAAICRSPLRWYQREVFAAFLGATELDVFTTATAN